MKQSQIRAKYNKFLSQRVTVEDRYTSYDLCYDYFFVNQGKLTGPNLENSCLHLWAFLCSWGMVARGNELQKKSFAFLRPVIEFIQNNPQYYKSTIDSPTYTAEMLDLYNGLKNALGLNQGSQKTIITKIMLGVFGCIPAFDTYVSSFFSTTTSGNLSNKNVKSVIDFYKKHKGLIDSLAKSTILIVFGGKSKITYTVAKIIDMIAFK